MEANPTVAELHYGNSYWMARLASLSYEKDSERILGILQNGNLQNEDGDSRFIAVHPFNKGSSQAILVEHENYYCIAFRGTDEGFDWLDNISFYPTKGFHRGFLRSIDRIWDEIYSQYKSCKSKKSKPLFLTGHSLGGAMAVIAATKLDEKKENFWNIYTFGQPRVLRPTKAEDFDIKYRSLYFRFNFNEDIVTRVPTRKGGYIHIGTYVHIFPNGTIEKNSRNWLNFVSARPKAAQKLRRNLIRSIEDHRMENYLNAIRHWDFNNT